MNAAYLYGMLMSAGSTANRICGKAWWSKAAGKDETLSLSRAHDAYIDGRYLRNSMASAASDETCQKSTAHSRRQSVVATSLPWSA